MALSRVPLMRFTFFDEPKTRDRLAAFVQSAPRLSMGDECAAFEKSFALWQERKHAILVSNGSTANLGLLQALLNLGRLKRGDKIGVSAVTWATNVMPILQLGMVPVAIDCSIDHLNVASKTLKKKIGPLKALFITNALGFCGDIDAIRDLCTEKGVILLEDNCESLGTRYNETLLGNFGLASTFSFFVGHHMSTIEGGMICTDDDELADMLIMVRAHGWDRGLDESKQAALRKKYNVDDFHAKYTFYVPAYNIRPTEITGFLGSLQLPMLQERIVKRERNFRMFEKAVSRRPDLYHDLNVSHIGYISNFAMPVITKSKEILQEAVRRFGAAGVEVRPVIAGDITEHPFWTVEWGKAECPDAAVIHAQGFYFPNNPDLTEEEIALLSRLTEGKE